jgi:hypothetical protein
MLVSEDKKSTRVSLNISSVFFHTFSKLVQALVTHDEIFQVLAVEGDALFPKPFVEPTPSTVQPRLGPLGLLRFQPFPEMSSGPRRGRCSQVETAGLGEVFLQFFKDV